MILTGGAVLAVVLLIALVMVGTSFEATNGGEVGVVRNGGPLANNNIREVLNPSSGRRFIGIWSSLHRYPVTQRYYTITSDPNGGSRPGVDIVHTPTSDGVDVGIEGTLYFDFNSDPKVISQFDTAYGIRTFQANGSADRFHPYEGDSGVAAFEDVIARPVIDNDLRQQVNNFPCAELVSSCALVQNSSLSLGGSPATAPTAINKSAGRRNNVNIQQIQTAINSSLQTDLNSTLGGNYLINIRFNLVRITLPQNVQDAVNSAQAAFAKVSEAQAQIAQANAQAQANEQRQRGYQQCPTCAQIDALRALPQGITVYAPGGNSAIALPTGK